MSGLVQGIFGGGQPAPPAIVIQSPPPAAPVAPADNDKAAEDARRKELAAMQAGVGRSNTILTDFALATQQPNTIRKTLGGA